MPAEPPNQGILYDWNDETTDRAAVVISECRTVPEALAAVSKDLGWNFTYHSVNGAMKRAFGKTMGSFLRQDPAPSYRAAPAREPPPAEEGSSRDTTPVEEAPDVDALLEEREAKSAAQRDRETIDELLLKLREARARQAFLDDIGKHREPPTIFPRERVSGVREMTPVVLASDWHVEEPVDPDSVAGVNEYNLAIADKRVRKFFQAIIWQVEHHRASGRILIRDLVLWLGGDLMSGYIHEELVEGNALSPAETVRWLLPRLKGGIRMLLEVLGLESIKVPCSYGNHGRMTMRPRVSTGAENNLEWLMYHSLADSFADDPRVQFDVTRSAHQYVQVYGTTVHFHHGDSVRYQGGVGGIGIPLLKAVNMWDRVKYAHVHCIGHWHQQRDFGRAIVNGSLIGFGPYAQSIHADPEPPQQMIFFVDSRRGKCMPGSLWVDDESEKDGSHVAA